MLILYGISNCDTIAKAKSWLSLHHIEFDFHDYKLQGISKAQLILWLGQIPLDKLVNKASTTYRQLTEVQKLHMVESEYAMEVMQNHPSIIKRPVLEKEGHILELGFKPDRYSELLLG
jgi:arsenate reductase (glutaredoxin)